MATQLDKLTIAKISKKTKYLYTKGGEFSLDGVEYVGEYHIIGFDVRTGPVPSQSSKLLRQYYTDPLLYEYDKARAFKSRDVVEPNQSVVRPRESDYTTGFMVRYFVERAGSFEGYPIEIDKLQYASYGKEGGISGDVYNSVAINWKLTGPRNNVFTQDGTLYEMGIFEHNQQVVYSATRIIPSLPGAIKNYLEFAKITRVYR